MNRRAVLCLVLGLLAHWRPGLRAAPLSPGATQARTPPAAPPAAPGLAGDAVEALSQALLQQSASDIPRPDDPERTPVRKALLAARKDALGKKALALRSVGELGRALVLHEWRVLDPDSEVADIDAKMYEQIATRFQVAVKNVSQRGGATTRTALANVVARLAEQPGLGSARTPAGLLFPRSLKKVAPDLIKLATTEDERQAVAAARMLAKAGRFLDGALDALAAMLASEKTTRLGRRAAAEALESLARPPTRLTGIIQPGDPAAEALEIRFLAQVVAAVGPGLADADAGVRRHSAAALRQTGQAIRNLWTLRFADQQPRPDGFATPAQNENVRADMRKRLRSLTPVLEPLEKQLPAVALRLADQDVSVVVAVCGAVEVLGDLRGLLLRLEARWRPVPKAEKPLDPCVGLRKLVPGLEKNLKHEEARVRLAAIYALESLGPDAAPAAPGVIQALAAKDPFVRWGAARALGKMAPHAADKGAAALAERLADESEDVRLTAALVLERYGPAARPAVAALGKAIAGGNTALRLACMRAVTAVGKDAPAAVPALIKVLSAPEAEVRRAAARALVRIDRTSDASIGKALRAALDDADAEVRRVVSEALLAE